ncbi:MAG TPA: HEAT repeat domain-containing protein, partial [Polyangiaceae bacterium]|nr:HEAT repeat domain-containing protein [Polyangiaceae bacterium]
LLLDASYAAETATRLVAVSGLAGFSDAAALSRVCEVARRDPEASVQHAAIELLADSAAPQATAALVALLSEDAYRARAVTALTRHGLQRAAGLSAALGQAPAEVAEAIVTVLTRLPNDAGERLLQASLEEPSDQARRAVVRALRFAFDSESTNEALARAASRDRDPEVRRIAASRRS